MPLGQRPETNVPIEVLEQKDEKWIIINEHRVWINGFTVILGILSFFLS